MLSKKILSLSLAAGLAVSAAPSIFAGNDGLELVDSTTCAESLVGSFFDAMAVEGSRYMFCLALRQSVAYQCAAVEALYHLLMSCEGADVNKARPTFEELYRNNEDFKKVVDESWNVNPVTGKKIHASVSGASKRKCSPIFGFAKRKCSSINPFT